MIVVALNGFLGNRTKHLDVTEIVTQAMDRLPDKDGITLIQGRGGAGPVAFQRLCKKLFKLSNQERVLVLVGKSYGAHWATRLLWKLADKEKLFKFRAVAMVTVDPAFTLSKMQKKTHPIPEISYAKNFHQYGYRSGYLLGPPAENIAIKGTHKTLERDPQIHQAVEDLLMWARVKQG